MALLSIVTANLRHGALRDGHPDTQFDAALDLISTLAPDILMLQETLLWWNNNHTALIAAEHDLGLRVPPGHVTHQSPLLMYRPGALSLVEHESHYLRLDGGPHGYSGITKFIVEDEHTLAASSLHLTPESTTAALIDLERAMWRTRRHSPNVIFGGDINHPPILHRKDPDWPDPQTLPAANVVGRYTNDPVENPHGPVMPSSPQTPDRSLGNALVHGRMADVAHLWVERTGTADVLEPTGRGGFRVDAHLVSEPLTPTIRHHAQVDNPHSDHRIVHTIIDTALIDPSLTVTHHR